MPSDAQLGHRERPVPIAAGPAFIFSLIVGWFFLASAVSAQGVVGSVTAIEGEATLEHHGRASKVVPAMALETNDRLVTQRSAHLTVTFGDNSSLELGESSSIVINEGVVGGGAASGISRVGLLGGHLHSIFNAGLRGISPAAFEVRTPNAIVGVRGTEFDTAYIAGTPCPGFPDCLRYTDVGVYKGRVEVTNPLNPNAPAVIATSGYETTVPCEQPPAKPSPLGMNEMLSPAYR
ncbi:MAG TPA: FecR domain-containing protein [Candidatus Binataceae bacterium]|nr:FecR domain-containing protein [Candidatus Binataceae bacterium]